MQSKSLSPSYYSERKLKSYMFSEFYNVEHLAFHAVISEAQKPSDLGIKLSCFVYGVQILLFARTICPARNMHETAILSGGLEMALLYTPSQWVMFDARVKRAAPTSGETQILSNCRNFILLILH